MTDQLNEEQIAQYKEAFSLIDKDGDGVIDVDDLPLLIRGLNEFPTNKELSEIIKEADPEGKRRIDFADFLAIMVKIYREGDPEETMLSAIDVLCDKKQKGLDSMQLLLKLKGEGEQLSQEECDEFNEFLNSYKLLNHGSEIKIGQFVRLLINLHRN